MHEDHPAPAGYSPDAALDMGSSEDWEDRIMKHAPLETVECSRSGGISIRIGKAGFRDYVEREHYLGGPFSIAEVRVENSEYESIEEETRRYARLMVAAPELLEALKFYVSICGNTAWQVGRLTAQEMYEQAQAAIAKAEE